MSDRNNPNGIENGDVVQLITGDGPKLAVGGVGQATGTYPATASCIWFEGGDFKKQDIMLPALRKAEPEKPGENEPAEG